MRYLVTGAAGFIGFHVTQRLLDQGHEVFGVDNVNDYYDPKLKYGRLAQMVGRPGFNFRKLDLAERTPTAALFQKVRPQLVIHLAAQAGVRYSMKNPHAYIDSNLVAFTNVLEGCRHHGVEHLAYASSSSVYGGNTQMPFSVHQNVDHPLSLYAATKKANELMAHSYSHIYGLPTTGLRFFTVYGPWGRPDMAMFIFAKAILAGEPIEVFNHGHMRRDFTYIDDIAEGVIRVAGRTATPNPAWNGDSPDPGTSKAPYRLYNIGNNHPVELLYLIEVLEGCLGRKAIKTLLPMQPGDVPATYANIDDLAADFGFKPSTSIEDGVRRFTDWYLDYHRANSEDGAHRQPNSRSKQLHNPHYEHDQFQSRRLNRASLPK
jgi:UDP-glucuronate 4-epimerase